MNRQQIALKMVLAELGISSKMNSFDERLVLQKAVYLVQQKGIPLGYHYGWYLRGPYSRDLTADAYATVSETPEGWFLDDATKSVLADLKVFFETLKKERVRAFEMLASVLFAIQTGQARATDTKRITSLMQEAGKTFTEDEVHGAVNILQKQGFIQIA